MAPFGRRVMLIAVLTVWAACSLGTAAPAVTIRFPFIERIFHKKPSGWEQFRLRAGNNAVLPGNLSVAWKVETGGQISSSPTIADGTLYIGNNIGNLYAIDVATGHVRWTYHVLNPLMSAPLIVGDLAIVGEGDATSMGTSPSEPIVVGMGPSALLAFDRKTGTLRWQVRLAGTGMPTPAIVDGLLVHHNGNGWVTGMDPATGRQRFATHLSSVASMSAILPIGNGDFITDGVGTNAVWRMSSRDGSTIWRSVFPSGVSGVGDCPPVTEGKRIYCDYVAPDAPDTSTTIGHTVTERAYAINAKTGALAWDVPLQSGTLPERNEAAIPLLANGLLYLGSAIAPVMHALDPATGRIAWMARTHGPIKGGAVLVNDTLYFGDLGGYLWALDAKTGRPLGVKNMHSPFNVGSPIVDGKTLIIGSNAGTIFALPLDSIRTARDS